MYQASSYYQPGEGSGSGQAAFFGHGGSDMGVSINHPSSAYEQNHFSDDAGTWTQLQMQDPAPVFADTCGETEQPEDESLSTGVEQFQNDPGDEGKGKQREKERREVKVTRKTHWTSDDGYLFRDVAGKTKTATESDWKRKRHNGRTVYEYEGRRFVYWCKRLKE